MYCNNCGKELPDESKFCNYCGRKVGTYNSIENNSSKDICSDYPHKKSLFIPLFLLVLFFFVIGICIISFDDSDIVVDNSYVGCTSTEVEEYLKENNINYTLSCDYSGETYIKADSPVIYKQHTNFDNEEVLELYSALPSVDIEGLSYDINEYDFLSTTLKIKNMSDKDIKYVHIYFTINNAVGDPLENESPFEKYDCLQFIGPLAPGEYKESYWENIFCNSLTKQFVINSVDIIFMDETTQHLNGTYTLELK